MAETNVPTGHDSDNPASLQPDVLLPADTVAQIRAALVEALAHHGGDLEPGNEPGLSDELRGFEAKIRGAIDLLDGQAEGAVDLPALWADLAVAKQRVDETELDIDDQGFAELASAHNDLMLDILDREPVTLADGAIQLRTILQNEDWIDDRVAPTLTRIADQLEALATAADRR